MCHPLRDEITPNSFFSGRNINGIGTLILSSTTSTKLTMEFFWSCRVSVHPIICGDGFCLI